MKKFTHSGLWAMLPCSQTNGSTAIDAAFTEFTDELHRYCRQEKDLRERTRTLRFARSELIAILFGAGEK